MNYFAQAKARAKRRRSPWNLLLIPAVVLPLIIIWAAAVLLAQEAHTLLYPGQTLRNGEGLWVVVTTVAPLLAAVPLGMLVGNFLVWRVNAARMALDREASGSPALSYSASQSALLKVAGVAVVASVAASALGTLRPW